jgi:hypothetical protein
LVKSVIEDDFLSKFTLWKKDKMVTKKYERVFEVL